MKSLFLVIACLGLLSIAPANLHADSEWGPTRVPSFGPNGTHWPSFNPTPYPYHANSSKFTRIEVDCSWTAIDVALSKLTAAQVDGGVIIFVRPGTLVGKGGGSASTAVIQKRGSLSWTKRVTIVPRDGYGTIFIQGGARYASLFNINIAGFIYDDLAVGGCTNSAVSWSHVAGKLTVTGDRELVTEKTEIVELTVGDEVQLTGTDRCNVSTLGKDIQKFAFVGCYLVPRNRPIASTSHTDTLQYGQALNGGTYSDMEITDCAIFGSDNTAIQTGEINGLRVANTYLCAGAYSRTRYPFPVGGDTKQSNHVFNGSGKGFQAIDSIFIGGETINTNMAAQPWSYVQNTLIAEFSIAGTSPLSGVFSIVSSAYPALPPKADAARRLALWVKGAAPAVVTAPSDAKISISVN